MYGSGGIGKTELASLTGGRFLDLEGGASELGAKCVEGVETWQDVLDSLNTESLWEGDKFIVIDTLTQAQQLAIAHTLETVKTDKGQFVSSIEGYGFGKGYQHVYETFIPLLAALDRHAKAGRHVICICHDITAVAPNPGGEDFLRYEPNLQQPAKSGRIRDHVKNWCDHLLFLQYDIHVRTEENAKPGKPGKAQGSGTRTIYCQEMPTYWAKSRRLSESIPYSRGSNELWKKLFGSK